jgi:hypothetical protein
MSPRLQPCFALHPLTLAGLVALAAFGCSAGPGPAGRPAGHRQARDRHAGARGGDGTRASLQRSLALKRNAAGVQDSISATELGRFPTTTWPTR